MGGAGKAGETGEAGLRADRLGRTYKAERFGIGNLQIVLLRGTTEDVAAIVK